MAQIVGTEVQRVYPVSTSKNPPSCVADSFGTPTGLHAIADRIGSEQSEGMVFKGRIPQQHFSKFPQDEQAKNLITSRILRLKGMEPKNSERGYNSYERYIYIHGTNHEERIGVPFSGGCIEMLNSDVIELFDAIQTGDLVWITES